MAANPVQSPPFTRLPVNDLTSATAAISDIYDKLQALTQKVSVPAPSASSIPSPPGIGTTGSIRTSMGSTFLETNDQTISFRVSKISSAILPASGSLPSRPFTIQNESGSSVNVNLQSPTKELVNGAAASSIVLAPGKSITIQPVNGGWVILSRIP